MQLPGYDPEREEPLGSRPSQSENTTIHLLDLSVVAVDSLFAEAY